MVNKISPSGELIWQNVFGGTGLGLRNLVKYKMVFWLQERLVLMMEMLLIHKRAMIIGLLKLTMKVSWFGKAPWGSGMDACFDISPTFDGGFILSGYSWSDNDGDLTGVFQHGRDDYWVVEAHPKFHKKILNLPKPSISQTQPRSISLRALTREQVNVTISNFHGQTILQKQMSPDEQINVQNLPRHYLVCHRWGITKTYLGKLRKL